MDEMESMFNDSNEHDSESATKRNSKESACSSDYASCITCICSSPHHEYDSQTVITFCSISFLVVFPVSCMFVFSQWHLRVQKTIKTFN